MLVIEGGRLVQGLSAVRKLVLGMGLGGMAVGNVIFTEDVNDRYLMAHECGHVEQARLLRPFYIPVVGSLANFGGPFERQADEWGRRFLSGGGFSL